jgi:hypothetical protein
LHDGIRWFIFANGLKKSEGKSKRKRRERRERKRRK